MKTARVRYGLITWADSTDEHGRVLEEKAFRGMRVALPDAEFDRLYAAGAVIPDDEELDQPGQMIELSDGATNEEVLAWAQSATDNEINVLAAARPALTDRLSDALLSKKARLEAQNTHLGGSVATLAPPVADVEVISELEVGLLDDDTSEDDDIEDAGVLQPEFADQVVQGNVAQVSAFLSENPRAAASILAAENRRASTTQPPEDARIGVIRAAQAAAAHVQ